MKTRIGIWTVIAGLALTGAVGGTSGYTVVVPEPLVVEVGDLGNVFLLRINDRGEAAGQAHGHVPGRTAGAAVRYAPGVGLENLDPAGNFNSATWQINDAGQVYGSDFANRGQIALFIHDESGFEFIHDDRGREFVSGFEAFGMNQHGVLVGATGEFRPGPVQAFRYSREAGWQDFTSFDSRFRRSSRAELINDRGDVVLTHRPTLITQDGFLLTAEGQLLEMGDLGGGHILPMAINESGQVVGSAIGPDGRDHGFLFTPGDGLVEVHPKGHRISEARHVTPDGVVAGASKRKRGGTVDTLFVRRPGSEPRPVIRRIRFKRLAAAAGFRYKGMDVAAINDRLEFVGSVWERGGVAGRSIPYLYSRATGLINLNEVVESAGVGFTATESLNMNNAGQILLSVTDGERRTTAILTPLE